MSVPALPPYSYFCWQHNRRCTHAWPARPAAPPTEEMNVDKDTRTAHTPTVPPIPAALEAVRHKCYSGCDAGCREDNLDELWPVAYVEVTRLAATELLRLATKRFADHGPHDIQGATLWNAGTHLNEKMAWRP